MHASWCDPDIMTYNIRIHGFCSIGRMSHAVMILDELVSSAKLIRMGIAPNVITVNLLLSHFCKQGMPDRALMWGQKLSDISFALDDITYIILDRAYRDLQEGAEIAKEKSGMNVFLDFLMYITYDCLYRNRFIFGTKKLISICKVKVNWKILDSVRSDYSMVMMIYADFYSRDLGLFQSGVKGGFTELLSFWDSIVLRFYSICPSIPLVFDLMWFCLNFTSIPF
ncbi:hypothetical protein NE237_025551 [Protea cynaroides]|uniref:Pentatricopeptide repeat-containing protein n=1 Tax=Protea cynaroides TaxID=273540 RepID=A0A9Q0H396_9MAGN|nr:hypothetical protein NE237_025551 [Protea cynaroides]